MKFSMMTYTLMRQKGFTPEDCVRTAVELKMDGIDWVTTYGRDPKELKKMSDDAGLTVAAHTFFVPGSCIEEKISNAERSLDDACILGAPLVMVPTAPLPNVKDAADCRKQWIEILAKIAPLAEQRNLILTVENFPGIMSGFVTASDFYEAKAVIPSLKLTFDNGNAATGEDQIESLKRCIDDVVHVHFKDWDFSDTEQEGMSPMIDGRYRRPALIGEGGVDSKATLKTLEELGYNGFINIEYENNKYPADIAVRKALEYLRA
ncbi:MAG: sugar phosphate isomerase/epimerase [Lentisphaeria bacterium]|nr:sugar phosphate isomerase/epimerase [Lentisphaeria bacterium]